MRFKGQLAITTAVSTAMLLAACGRSSDWNEEQLSAVCRDRAGKRVDDRYCNSNAGGSGGASSAFLWYYLGRASSVPAVGQPAYGGSFTPAAGASYSTAARTGAPSAASVSRSSVSRGGFGSSAHSFGSVSA